MHITQIIRANDYIAGGIETILWCAHVSQITFFSEFGMCDIAVLLELQHHVHYHLCKLGEKATFHQVTTMLATSKNVLFLGHNHHANHRYWWTFTLIIAGAPLAETNNCPKSD